MKTGWLTLLLWPGLMLCGADAERAAVTDLPADQTHGRRIELRNPLLKVLIEQDLGGVVGSFVPANTGHEEVYSKVRVKLSLHSFCRMRIAEMNEPESGELNSGVTVRIVRDTPEEAAVSCT